MKGAPVNEDVGVFVIDIVVPARVGCETKGCFDPLIGRSSDVWTPKVRSKDRDYFDTGTQLPRANTLSLYQIREIVLVDHHSDHLSIVIVVLLHLAVVRYWYISSTLPSQVLARLHPFVLVESRPLRGIWDPCRNPLHDFVTWTWIRIGHLVRAHFSTLCLTLKKNSPP